jgi:hypothetical protein
MNEKVFIKIKEFVKEQRWEYDFDLERNTELVKHLKIDGDDASEFLEAFRQMFQIDVSKFDFDDYFDAEGDRVLPSFKRMLFGVKEPTKKTLTLGDLENAVLTGQLNDETIRLRSF